MFLIPNYPSNPFHFCPWSIFLRFIVDLFFFHNEKSCWSLSISILVLHSISSQEWKRIQFRNRKIIANSEAQGSGNSLLCLYFECRSGCSLCAGKGTQKAHKVENPTEHSFVWRIVSHTHKTLFYCVLKFFSSDLYFLSPCVCSRAFRDDRFHCLSLGPRATFAYSCLCEWREREREETVLQEQIHATIGERARERERVVVSEALTHWSMDPLSLSLLCAWFVLVDKLLWLLAYAGFLSLALDHVGFVLWSVSYLHPSVVVIVDLFEFSGVCSMESFECK